ncbi:carbohydrate esterase family 5 protein [Hypoxylon crocopeplum]|nr:carbohydrate esterase family 5 protein [Hypoxylon crocopeplum]
MRNLGYAVALSSSVFSALAAAQESGLDTCTDVHIFLSRGNNEPYPGRQGKLVQAICSGLSNCDYEDIAFDNALQTEYCSAIIAGGAAGISQITAYNERCPDTKLVVSGYSQGAQVVGDILGGGGGVFFQGCTTPATAGLDPNSAPGNMIAAALLFGDTRHTASQPYNTLGGSPFNGLFPRTGQLLAGINSFASVLRDWCQGDDPICAQGDGKRTYNVQHHLNYFDVYSDAAGEWVRSMVGEATTPTSTSTSSSATVSSTTTTSSVASSAMNDTSTSLEESSTSVIVTTTSTSVTSTQTTAMSSNSTSSTLSTSPATTSSNSNSSSLTRTSTVLPETTDSGASVTPTPTSSTQGNGAGVVRCFRSYVGFAVLSFFVLTVM